MSEERFNVVVHHGGTLVCQYPIEYVGGEKTYWSVDPDRWSYFEAVDAAKELGYINVRDIFYCIDNMLLKLDDDKSAMNMGKLRCMVHGVDDDPELVEIEPSELQQNQVLLLCQGTLGREGLNDDVHNEEEKDDMDDEQREVHVEEEVDVEEVHLEEEEVHVEDYTSSVSDDSGDVHSLEGEGHEAQRDVDEGEGDEGLVDVDVNVDEVLRDNIKGAISVEVSENEESGSEDEVDIAHTEKNPYDRGLSDDEWESEFLPSPDESGSEDESQSCGPFGTFVMQKSMSEYKWEVGTKFRDKNEFMEVVRSYAVHGERDLKFIKNDNRRVRVRCLGAQKSCPWMAYYGYMEGCSTWQLRKVVDNHSCSRQFNIKMMNVKWLSDTLDNSMQQNPNLKINEIRSKALRKWNTNVTLSKAPIEQLLPKAEHRFCMRHRYANFRKKFSGQKLKNLMWKAAASTYPQAWEKEMLNMKEVNEEAYKYLIVIPPRKWLLTGIPCCHAIAAMKFLNLDPENYVPIWFRRSTYEEAYASIIFPVNGHLLWERTPYVDVLPPSNRKLPGRPKKRDETQMTKGGHHKKCSICRQVGHKRNKCPTQHQADLPGPSQPPPQQPIEEITQPSQPPPEEMTQQSEPPPIRPNKLPIRRQRAL
ncbi:hypothetical protein V8G54_004859 [Vigna mungo]|uniref:Zinc finger PMZ-type domain-containing protein n=1 Tax=Vigna mungo TaxID=3915 RepID=A0AAQ3PIP9_VIGMU